ncbi:uncharacterized protein STEHIDRAFT_163326 [Stereum hirsutum FP-91666 SS1]|uniref:Uncharacterized protein n=1 Tax=Stereum hirsutum (strain FP-91666) TaxID=721885 RepID=R7RZM5_STEHR|nr:uncharacterized protein STEHIDRAFT_163326 [Stereum hirsutum FP-91666 SS1]EIM79767.1 hypothetical protein STEHIDRAFT_163326 [Stereum hirsutum FP-91666 SS1]
MAPRTQNLERNAVSHDEQVPHKGDVWKAMEGSIVSPDYTQTLVARSDDYSLSWTYAYAQSDYGDIITADAEPWSSAAMIPGVEPIQHHPSNYTMLFTRGWFNIETPYTIYRPAPITEADRRRICILPYVNSNWLPAEALASSVDQPYMTRLASGTADALYSRVQRYQAICQAIISYFDIARCAPPMDLLESPRLFAQPRDAMDHVRRLCHLQLLVWGWQGLIRWAFSSISSERWPRTPLPLQWDWAAFIDGEDLFRHPCIGAVVDWGGLPDRRWPNVSWFLRRGIRMDWLLSRDMRFYPPLGNIGPNLGNIPFAGRFGRSPSPVHVAPRAAPSSLSNSRASSPIAQMGSPPPPGTDPVPDFDWPAPPLLTPSSLSRDLARRNHNDRYDQQKWGNGRGRFDLLLLFSRCDSTRVAGASGGFSADDFRYATLLPHRDISKVIHFEFRRDWPGPRIGGFILPPRAYRGQEKPEIPDSSEEYADASVDRGYPPLEQVTAGCEDAVDVDEQVPMQGVRDSVVIHEYSRQPIDEEDEKVDYEPSTAPNSPRAGVQEEPTPVEDEQDEKVDYEPSTAPNSPRAGVEEEQTPVQEEEVHRSFGCFHGSSPTDNTAETLPTSAKGKQKASGLLPIAQRSTLSNEDARLTQSLEMEQRQFQWAQTDSLRNLNRNTAAGESSSGPGNHYFPRTISPAGPRRRSNNPLEPRRSYHRPLYDSYRPSHSARRPSRSSEVGHSRRFHSGDMERIRPRLHRYQPSSTFPPPDHDVAPSRSHHPDTRQNGPPRPAVQRTVETTSAMHYSHFGESCSARSMERETVLENASGSASLSPSRTFGLEPDGRPMTREMSETLQSRSPAPLDVDRTIARPASPVHHTLASVELSEQLLRGDENQPWPWTEAIANDPSVQELVSTDASVTLIRGDRAPLELPHRLRPSMEGFIYLTGHGILRAAVWRHRVGWHAWEEFVLYLFGHGIPFEWAVPTALVTSLDRVPPPLSWMQTDPVTQWWNHHTGNIVDSWSWALAEVLRRPHAVRALVSGGVLWRLAIEFGPAGLLREAVRGPSIVTTHYRRGRAHARAVPTSSDQLSRVEINALTGRHPSGRSLWPTNEELFVGRVWNGEWSRWCEKWFVERLNEIRSTAQEVQAGRRPPENVFVQSGGWIRQLRLAAKSSRRKLDGPGSEAWVGEFASRMSGWSRLNVIHISGSPAETDISGDPGKDKVDDRMEE